MTGHKVGNSEIMLHVRMHVTTAAAWMTLEKQ